MYEIIAVNVHTKERVSHGVYDRHMDALYDHQVVAKKLNGGKMQVKDWRVFVANVECK